VPITVSYVRWQKGVSFNSLTSAYLKLSFGPSIAGARSLKAFSATIETISLAFSKH
jgi:hypothetical protein